jgi:hypothetical protein
MFLNKLRKFRFDRPQQFAALLLLALLIQCLWIIHRQSLTARDYEFAQCGREMWEKPSPLAGYFTSCGNIHDGTLAYRAAGLPLTIERILAGESAQASPWELRHQLGSVSVLLRLPFLAAALALGACLWWVTRRLYGNAGGYVALGLYSFCPAVLRAATSPNNDILAAFGLFSIVYTAIGVAHALQGPKRKWRPRIVLLTVAFGFTATAHVSAVLLGFLFALVFMGYLAEGRRSYLPTLAIVWAAGTLLILFASYAFRPDAFSYVFRSDAARMWFSTDAPRYFFSSLPNAATTIAAAASLVLYAAARRSRYFGNTAPLVVAALLFLIVTTRIDAQPWLWAIPFLFTFIGGVFADVLEGPHRKLFVISTTGLVAAQALLALATLRSPAS